MDRTMEEEAAYTLPSPSDTPYRTPSSSRSLRSRTGGSMSPSSTPPPLPEDRNGKRQSTESINPALDESISPWDPRRFTPTLHASLVSEILSLRRAMENKTNDIEKLEQSLHQANQQNDVLNTSLLNSNKQTREVKRQMQLLEGGTLSAISDISSERDNALKDVAEFRRRLEQSQKRAKTQEDTAERTQELWNKERESWHNEKRALETKVHIAEGRLKVVLDEVANAQHTRTLSPERGPVRSPERQSVRVESRNSILESPGLGRGRSRRYSARSVNSDHDGGRISVLSFANGATINLADELAFDEEEEDHFNAEYPEHGRISPDALPEEHHELIRPASSLSIKARKVLGLPFDIEGEDKENVDPAKTDFISQRSASYVDTAIQFSPPSSPRRRVDSPDKRRSNPAGLHLHESRHSRTTSHSPVSPTESMDSRYAPWNYTGPIMVSSACQTVEALPSPPLMPEKPNGHLSTIQEDKAEFETSTVGTQTDPVQIKEPKIERSWHHISTESGDLQIPIINIIPPTSRPVTPEAMTVVLPPRTRNAGAQVDFSQIGVYKSSSMQTEEIRVDRRNIIPPAQMPVAPPASAFKAPISIRSVALLRGRKPGPSNAITASRRMNVGITRIPPTNDNGTQARDFASKFTPPVRSSSLVHGSEEANGTEDDQFEVDTLPEDDVFSRPTAKFTLRSGKLVSQDPVLEDIGEVNAANAGETAALETLRASEESLPPDMKQFFMRGRKTPPVGVSRPPVPSKSLRRVPSAKSNNMRRAALISSGSAAHRASNSASTNASVDSANPPPFPVPLRYSSAKVHKSVSEGGRSSRASSAASPTKPSKSKGKNILRKTRSGPAISPHPQARKSRSRSPPMDSRVSIVPEMPTFYMPAEAPAFLAEPYSDPHEASAPRPSIATGPSRKMSHMKANSDVHSMQQTSVVDSIAQTMVGEWMFKYVRRRKSFGMNNDKSDWDANKSVEEISASVTNTGVRHKRWVWLAPYERAVMWSSKQPTSGSALMGGKSGRKLTIKSVLDVKDDNPMPKGSLSGPHFNRSILILTPERALKFTATSQDRHFVWLTALSFLSHSPLSVNDLTAMPPPPPEDQLLANLPQASLAGSFRRRPIRDSIRIAKGSSNRQQGPRSFTDGSAPVSYNEYNSQPPSRDYYDPTQDSALPPTIKRFHARKRSNTTPTGPPKAPPSSFRGFTATSRDVVPPLPAPKGYTGTASSSVIASTNGSDRGMYTPSLGVQSIPSSRRGSEASRGARPMPQHAFTDYSQTTMRVDAFADMIVPIEQSRRTPLGQYMDGPFPALRNGTLKKKDLGYWGFEDGRDSISPVDSLMHSEMMAAAEGSTRPSVDSRMTDPFRGF